MAYQLKLSDTAIKQLAKLGKIESKRLLDYLKNRVLIAEHPRVYGKPLVGNFSGLWRYRVGDYRIVCEIQDEQLVLLVVKLGSRGEIYR